MARTVHCVLLKREAEGLERAPYPGELGRRIYEQVMAQYQDNFAAQQAAQELRKLKK